MDNFWDYNVWNFVLLIGILLGSLLAGNLLKRSIPALQASLIPTSVIGGLILLVITAVYRAITGRALFDSEVFSGYGTATLEIITYHALALGFIASTLKTTDGKFTKQRTTEIFNTGVTTVSSYLMQGILGLGITMIAAKVVSGFFPAAGLLLPFGYGQGTGQAMNYGNIYETEFGFAGGKSFGLAVAALGFLSAAIGGVIYLNVAKKRGKLKINGHGTGELSTNDIQSEGEIPMQESIDKLTIQLALIALAYMIAYLLMKFFGSLLPGMRSVIYGFNFLLGVMAATLLKAVMNFLKKKGVIKQQYTNNFLMTRASNFFFDLMIVAGVAAIRPEVLKTYWGLLLILGIVGAVSTFLYNRYVADKLFPGYATEQFLVMYGMLTGTASTGIILLREVDGDFVTPASENLVYQNFPAIVFGFPMMLLATMGPVKPLLTWMILIGFFAVMNVILFRSFIFKKKSAK